jgi:hypothetical protein
MEFWQLALALICGIIFLGFFSIFAFVVICMVYGQAGSDGEKYVMDEETFERIKEAQYLQMNNLFGNIL